MRRRKIGVLAPVLCLAVHRATADVPQNPRDNFCRRIGHQTTFIDDKLYIDSSFVNFDTFPTDNKTYPNTWLGFQDFDNLTLRSDDALWPNLNIGLNKDPNTIPTVHGGALWGDSVNKRFFLFGGENTKGVASTDFHLLSYDILNDEWDDFGPPDMPNPPNISSYGAGVGVSETGQGYYYGGWISNASMRGWTQDRTMSSAFYKYEYDTNATTGAKPPDELPRAEGAMVWIPAGYTELLIYFFQQRPALFSAAESTELHSLQNEQSRQHDRLCRAGTALQLSHWEMHVLVGSNLL
ncbi:hypothetical protein C8A01DRAFT_21140 [Parachaetomium inaequale]|uniref:Kelch repeat-containing protein n=1 Tax=Parachaetomium inaequale TaxID=2588326 RepID=A0AAN6P4M2_9PEZI|nr:hypothetical protein C8A01DRAFT_21140 [Parachaetomium inaequale]